MPHVIGFRSNAFEVATETPNPFNPIPGEGVLAWLAGELRTAGYQTTAPAPEDWGWLVEVTAARASYLVGASGDVAADPAAVEWTVQVHRRRSLWDRLAGTSRLTADDPLAALVERLIRQDPRAADVHVRPAG